MRKFGPKKADHPGIGMECPACHELFVEGDYTTLAILGPGGDPEARKRRDEGRFYTAVALEIHWDCSEQTEDLETISTESLARSVDREFR